MLLLVHYWLPGVTLTLACIWDENVNLYWFSGTCHPVLILLLEFTEDSAQPMLLACH